VAIKGCIFGLDGVLTDTAKYHYVAWKKLAIEFDLDLTDEMMEVLRPLDRLQCMEKIIVWSDAYMSEAEKLFWTDIKNNWYRELIIQMKPNELLPGVLPLLEKIKTQNIALALTSASKNAKTVLNCLKIEDYFDTIVDGEMTKKSKPNPECYLLTAEKLKIKPADCLVFEDTAPGVEAAIAGGFKVVGISKNMNLTKAHWQINGLEKVEKNLFSTIQPLSLTVQPK
jgi:beta-phosphoglucomutase